MKKELISNALVLFSFIIMVGCSSGEEYKFEGESEHWESYLQVSEVDGEKTEEFIVRYKGDLEELSSVQEIEYSYQASKTSGETTRNFGDESPNQKEFSSSGSSLIDKGEAIEVEVKWGDKKETMKLN